MKHSLKKQLKGLYQAPQPPGKTIFLQELNYPLSTFREFLGTQAGYIHKYIWILSVLLVGAAIAAGRCMANGNEKEVFPVLGSISSVMPILVLLLILETFRSEVYGMAELEQAAKHNLPEVLLVRMGIVAAVDLILIGAAVPVIVRCEELSAFRAAVYLLVPYLFTCLLTLEVQRRKRGRETVWYSILISTLTCGINAFSHMVEVVYEESRFFLWVVVLCLAGIVVAIQINTIRKSREEYGWNLYLNG